MKTQESHIKNGSHINGSHTNGSHNGVSTQTVLPDEDTIPKAKALLTKAARGLPQDSPLTDKARRALVPLMRITPAMLSMIADAYEEHADVIGGAFDLASVRDAVAFEQTHRPLSAQAKALSSRIDEQILVRRAAAAEACLGVYQAMKGLTRLQKGAVLRPAVKQIGAAVKVIRHKAKIAAPAPTTPAPAAPPPPAAKGMVEGS